MHRLSQALIQEIPGIVDEAVTAIFEDKPHYTRLCESYHTPLEHYESHPFLALDVDDKLMQDYPERFQGVSDVHTTRVAELDEKIAALG